MRDLISAFLNSFGDNEALQLIYVIFASIGLMIYGVYGVYRTARAIGRMQQRRTRRRQVESTLAALVAELPALRRRLLEIKSQAQTNALHALVAFFNATSTWQDRELYLFVREVRDLNDPRHKELFGTLQAFVEQIAMCGRVRNGWNRTEKGELVTGDKVYLGGIWGYFTLTVNEWIKGMNQPKGTHGWASSDPYFRTRNGYDVMCDEAAEFINDHTPRIVELIDELTRQTSPLRLVA